MFTYTKGWTLALISITLGACGCSQSPGRNEANWDDLAQWVGADVSNPDFVRFVRDHKLLLRHDVDCGVLADSPESYWMNIRNKQVVRVAVRIHPVGPQQHAFTGRLISGIERSDSAEDVIRKRGSPTYDNRRNGGSRYLVYEPNHLVFDFRADGGLFEIQQGSLDDSDAPNESLDQSHRPNPDQVGS